MRNEILYYDGEEFLVYYSVKEEEVNESFDHHFGTEDQTSTEVIDIYINEVYGESGELITPTTEMVTSFTKDLLDNID